jgi:hypothetical protein
MGTRRELASDVDSRRGGQRRGHVGGGRRRGDMGGSGGRPAQVPRCRGGSSGCLACASGWRRRILGAGVTCVRVFPSGRVWVVLTLFFLARVKMIRVG